MISKKANKVLTVSEFTKSELVRLTSCKKDNIFVTYNGVDKSWFNVEKKKSPLPGSYILYVGNVKPHKNLNSLIEAFEHIKDQIPHRLVVVGKKEGFITADNDITLKAEKLEDRVHFTGFVNDDLLKQFTVHADAMVFPSLYEGFGLPPLEAMAVGCPVLASEAASIPEVCGEAAIYFDPQNPQEIGGKVVSFLKNIPKREELIVKGKNRAQKFSWEKCAEQTLLVLKEELTD
jgi:glycosyltransferase involved in cell wall biosynthesis